jgi:hypothetical protein
MAVGLDETHPHYDKLDIAITQCEDNDLFIRHGRAGIDALVEEQILKGIRTYTCRRFTSRPFNQFPLLNTKCPFCRVALTILKNGEMRDCNNENELDNWFEWADLSDGVEQVSWLEYCTRCYYWCWHYLESKFVGTRGVHFFHDYVSYLSKIKDFTNSLPEVCSTEFAQWARRNPNVWHTINPHSLERLVADIFRVNYLDAEVFHVGKPCDGGVDVLFIDTGGKQWLIQVKRREDPNSSEPVDTVRKLLGTMFLEGASYGIVVSTADHFTYHAYADANRAKERGVVVKLIDRGKLDRMLDPVLPDRPWVTALKADYPDLVNHFTQQIPSPRQLRLFKKLPRLR